MTPETDPAPDQGPRAYAHGHTTSEAGAGDGIPMFFGVAAGAIPLWWRAARPLVARAADRSDGRYRADDVLAARLRREMQLWVAVDRSDPERIEALCVTEIAAYPQEKRCGLVFCAGRDAARWISHLDDIAAWARAQGCAALEFQGRTGWERLLKGWEKTHVLLRKRI